MNEISLLLQGKQLIFKHLNKKLELWKIYMHDLKLDSSLILKDSSDEISGDIDQCDFSNILYNEMCCHSDGLHKSLN